MRVFKTKAFSRLAAGDLPDAALFEAAARADSGLGDAHLGKWLYKLRVARPGAGRSGGYRVIVVIRSGEFALFVYMFAKKERANLDDGELAAYRKFAIRVGGFDSATIAAEVHKGTWIEVRDDDQTPASAKSRDGRAARGGKRSL